MANRILNADGWQQRIRDKMGVFDSYLPDSLSSNPIFGVAGSKCYCTNTIMKIGGIKTYLESAVVVCCGSCLLCKQTSHTRTGTG